MNSVDPLIAIGIAASIDRASASTDEAIRLLASSRVTPGITGNPEAGIDPVDRCRARCHQDILLQLKIHLGRRCEQLPGPRDHQRRMKRLIQFPAPGNVIGGDAVRGQQRRGVPSGSRRPLTTNCPPSRPLDTTTIPGSLRSAAT